MPRKRSPKRGAVDFADLVARSGAIDGLDERLRRDGYERAYAQAYGRRDGTYTVRCVWRMRGVLTSAVTCSLQGVVLS